MNDKKKTDKSINKKKYHNQDKQLVKKNNWRFI